MSRKIDWCYWLLTAALLSASLFGAPVLLLGAIAVTAWQLADFAIRSHARLSFQLQVRAVYMAMLLIGSWPPMAWIHWMQVVGTWAVVLVDYCFLARLLSLAPWNRHGVPTRAEIVRAFLSAPKAGSVMQGSARGQARA
jgi:hypothetical protein